jgi:hypothetical protein
MGMKYIVRSVFVYAFVVCLSACADKDSVNPVSLNDYIQSNGFTLVKDQLIACAAGGQTGFLEDQEKPTSIFFYPKGNAHTFKYFETDTGDIDSNDLSLYTEKSLKEEPIFNGYLRRFIREKNESPIWCIVTFIKDESLHISNPIKIKFPDVRSEFNPSLLTINLDEKLSPKFSWNDGLIDENEIYFHVVSDENGTLISGTYTYDKNFKFYDLSNVVLNIRDIKPIPALQPNETYTLTIMGVSVDNWVNLIIEKDFKTE